MKSINPIRGLAPLIDVVAIFLGGMLAYQARFESLSMESNYVLMLVVMALLVVLINLLSGGYSKWRSMHLMKRIYRLLGVWGAIFVLVGASMFLLKVSEDFSRQWIVFTLALSFCLACASRAFLMMLIIYHNADYRNRKKVFLVGPGEVLHSVARTMRQQQQQQYAVAGVCRTLDYRDPNALEELARRVQNSNAREVWLCMPVGMGDSIKPIMYALRQLTVEIRFMPQFSEIPLLNHRVSNVAGLYSFDLSVSPIQGGTIFLKRLEDIVVGSLILFLIAPVCLVVAAMIKLTSPGPVLFKQYRTGMNGEAVLVYKFRSMKVHREDGDQVTQATRNDSRITPFGAFLRRTSLDELPQFINVLQGKMSIVGPRPHALAHNDYYKDLVESYMQRHKVKPGITGWAQVCGYRGETDTLEKMQKRVECDLWYINNWSLYLDLKIIFLTIFRGFINDNAY